MRSIQSSSSSVRQTSRVPSGVVPIASITRSEPVEAPASKDVWSRYTAYPLGSPSTTTTRRAISPPPKRCSGIGKNPHLPPLARTLQHPGRDRRDPLVDGWKQIQALFRRHQPPVLHRPEHAVERRVIARKVDLAAERGHPVPEAAVDTLVRRPEGRERLSALDRKSTRLNSSHVAISYAVFCL